MSDPTADSSTEQSASGNIETSSGPEIPGQDGHTERADLWEHAASALPFVVWTCDQNGTITEVRGREELAFEKPPLHANLSSVVKEDLSPLIATSGRQQAEVGDRWLEVTVEEEAGRRTCTVIDVSRWRGQQDVITNRTRRLEAVGSLSAGIAHDFNNLLTVILTYTDSLLYELPEIDPRRRDVDEIRAAANQAARLTRQLHSFTSQSRLDPEHVNVNESLNSIIKLVRRLLGANIDVKTTAEEAVGTVFIDPGAIEQVMLNMAVTAREAMGGKPGRLHLETANVLLDEKRANNMGLSPGHHIRLSAALDADIPAGSSEVLRGDSPLLNDTIGLTTILGVAEQSEGAVAITASDELQRIDVFLPHAEEESHGPVAGEPKREVVTGSTILLVEDDPALRRLACRVLRDQGYEVLAARDGEHALAKASLHESPIDLIVTDVVMPRMGGQELARQLRRQNDGIQVLFTSGYREKKLEPLSENPDQRETFLPKPYTRSRLLDEVREMLRKRAE